MDTKIYYASKTGNTKKIAETMAKVLSCSVAPMTANSSSISADILFLGAAVYATHDHDIDPLVREFIGNLDVKKIKKAVLFCTGFANTAIVSMKSHLAGKGIPVDENTFFCKGNFFIFFNFGHPNSADLKAAENFALEISKK